ncbi:MAG: MFS transporter, partial [Alphaproteobacteria bacterium]|nr:MFS transporter [Alphaproteobacteria bacterium]
MSAKTNPIDRLPIWAVVLTCAVIVGISMGIRQSMGLFMKPMSDDLGLGIEVFSMAIAIANIVWGLTAPFTGAIAD